MKFAKMIYFEKTERFPHQSPERCLKICQNVPNRLKLKVKKTKLTAIYIFWDLWKGITGGG